MVSISDVAKRVGCSTTLVSRVVNNQYGVSDKSRAKIKKAIEELGYTPNVLARSLVLKKTNTIGVVLDNLCDAYFFDLIDGIEKKAEEYGVNVLFCNGAGKSDKKNSYINFFIGERVDGIIIYGSSLDDMALIRRIAERGFPLTIIENDIEDIDANNIILDNEYGSYLAVEHLFEQGCRNICFVDGEKTVQAAQRRRSGFIKSMAKRNVREEDLLILECGWKEEDGYSTISRFIESVGTDGLPDGFYFSSDQAAFGGMRAFVDAGVDIPGDVRIIGFDNDMPHTRDFAYLPLSTIHQPLKEMGISGVELLMEAINSDEPSNRRIEYKPSLIVRETT